MISAAKWGTLVGVGSYLILTVGLTLLNFVLFGTDPADLNHPGPLTFVCLGIFGILFAFSAAGYFTGRETQKVGWGMVSAMIALAVYSLLSHIYTPTTERTSTSSTASQLPLAAQVLFAVAAAVLVLLVAAGMGWLGARPAVQQAQKRLNSISRS